MMTTEFIGDNFRKQDRNGKRWVFEPTAGSLAPTHRYFLTFLTAERRFLLTRQQIQPFENVTDENLLAEFRGMLSAPEIADCMREVIASPPDSDDIPF